MYWKEVQSEPPNVMLILSEMSHNSYAFTLPNVQGLFFHRFCLFVSFERYTHTGRWWGRDLPFIHWFTQQLPATVRAVPSQSRKEEFGSGAGSCTRWGDPSSCIIISCLPGFALGESWSEVVLESKPRNSNMGCGQLKLVLEHCAKAFPCGLGTFLHYHSQTTKFLQFHLHRIVHPDPSPTIFHVVFWDHAIIT